MKILEFCPSCGMKTLQWKENKKWICTQCHFTLYHNTAAAVAVLFRYQNEIYLTQRNQEPKIGLLDLPGGFVDEKESAEEACKREIFEELSIMIYPEKLVYLASIPNTYLYKEILYQTLDLFFEYPFLQKPTFKINQEELSSGVWMPINEIKPELLAFDSQKEFIEKYLSKNKIEVSF